jgi:site-specific recombinase XerD
VLLLRYLQKRLGRTPSSLNVTDLDSGDILAFLDYLEQERGNKVKTRNARLAAIRCAVDYALMIDPTLPPTVHRILAIPVKKTKRPQVEFLEQPEVDALLAAPDADRWSGRRDRLMFEVMYNIGARVSEMVQVRVSDVCVNETGGQIVLHGKGRKERTLPLWATTAKRVRQWIQEEGLTAEGPLFPRFRGGFLTRSAVAKRVDRAVAAAKKEKSMLKEMKASPHTLRHTTAMHMHDSGVDIAELALWLGHESIETTNIYLSTSVERKERTLEKLKPPTVSGFRYRPDDKTLAYLESL